MAATRGAPVRRGGSGNRGSLHIRKVADHGIIIATNGTRRKASKDERPDFANGESWGLDYVRVLPLPGAKRGDPVVPEHLDLSESLYHQGLRDGWLSAKGGAIEMEVLGGTVRWEIVDSPGRKPDGDEPSGTRVDHFYELKLAGKPPAKVGMPEIAGGADFAFNISKGQIKTQASLPAGSDAIIVILLKVAGIEADDTLNNYDDVSALLAAANDESTASDYARKSITSATLTVDDTNNWLDIDVADQTWVGLGGADNTAIGDALFAHDADTGAGTDANLTPMSLHDFTITPDNSDVTLQVAAAGLLRAA